MRARPKQVKVVEDGIMYIVIFEYTEIRCSASHQESSWLEAPCSPRVCLASLRVLQLPPSPQKHAC